jgi:uncharacterized protein (TIGR02466 family)
MALVKVYPMTLLRERFPKSVAARLNRDLLKDIEVFRSMDVAGQKWSRQNYIGGYTSYASLSDLHQRSSVFAELETRLKPAVKRFTQAVGWKLGRGKLKMTTCWINVMPFATHHTLHTHPLSVLSGTYYVETPSGSSPLKFEDPRLGLLMASPPRKEEPFLSFPAEAGCYNLFESWVRHEVPPHRGKKPRISVSFNWEWVSR